MKALFSVLITLLVSAVHLPANAIFFFRAVGAGPDIVFPRGFLPWGTNPSLALHVGGTTCNRRNAARNERDGTGSRYISMGATLQDAMGVARTRLLQTRPTAARPVPMIWIYEIRPTARTYDVVRTFERANTNLVTGPLNGFYLNALYYHEWVEDGPITPERIRSAAQYQLVNGQVEEVPGTGVTNADYVETATSPNPDPLPASVITGVESLAQRTRAVIGAAATGLLSACWCDTASVGPAKRSLDEDPVDACQANIQYLNDVVPRAKYIPSDGWELTNK